MNMDSDLESEADFYRKLTQRETSHESDFMEESILSPEEDDEDGDFKVHFVHHGKKAEVSGEMQSDLLYQINELQEAVISMKSSLTEAVTKLSMVEGTSPQSSEVDELRRKCEGNSAEILKMVLALKTDFSSLKHDVSAISKRQEIIQKSLLVLLEDRKILASDLSKSNVISAQTRTRLDSTPSLHSTGGHSGSGSHSNDSGVALLLEKTQNAFGEDSGPLQLSGQRVSDQDSLPEQPSLLVPPSVYDYVAGLSHHTSSVSSNNQFCSHEGLSTPANDDSTTLQVKDEPEYERRDSFDLGAGYDSDSSLTVAANKTISLSTCISQEIRVHEASYPATPTSTHYSTLEGVKDDKRVSRLECETPSPSKDKISSQNRRRRPLLGVSSTKMYLSTSHCHPSSADKEHHKLRHRYISKGGDPREAQRYKLAKELVDTEKHYCKTLWTIQDVFAEPLKKSGILSTKDIKTLFPEEVYLLYDKHCFLQHQLKERLASWKWQPLIGDILARFTDPQQCEVLRLYTSYVNDFPQILKTFHKLCHSSQSFTNFIKRCLDQPACQSLDLGAFLLTPVQRVPKYILLLKQLLKYTSSNHPDHRHIGIVLERLRDFLSRLNSAMEESFLIVNSSLSPPIGPSSGVSGSSMLSAVPALPLGAKHRSGKNSRKSCASSKDNLASSSPSNRRSRHSKIYQPSSSSPGGEYRSPKRSSSMACGTDSPHKSPSKHFYTDRSASLPRGFTSMSSDSPDSSGDGLESSPERILKGGSNMRQYSPHESTPYHYRSKYSTLTPARSVTNVLTDLHLEPPLEGLASSEPSLIEKSKIANTKILSKKSTASNNAQILNEPEQNNAHKLVHWTECSESTEDKKKKPSIKSSLKNMFTFKKRPLGHQNSREESFYVSSSIILENPAEYSPSHTQYNQPQRISVTNQTGSSNGNGESSSSGKSGSPAAIGDFLDEEGNPCSNV